MFYFVCAFYDKRVGMFSLYLVQLADIQAVEKFNPGTYKIAQVSSNIVRLQLFFYMTHRKVGKKMA